MIVPRGRKGKKGFKPRKSKPVSAVTAPKSKQAMTKLIKKVVKGVAETKQVIYYGDSLGMNGNGSYATRSFFAQNQFINNTITDVHRIIPFLTQGISDNQRIGESVQPVSLTIKGCVKINAATVSLLIPVDIFAVIYLLEHKIYKNYDALRPSTAAGGQPLGNDFNQLLYNGENTTRSFAGDIWSSQLPVTNQYYRVLAKKIVRLRYAGQNGAQQGLVSIANSHDYLRNFSFTLTQKQLPKVLRYPENTNAGGGATSGLNDPTNYAPFWAIGYYEADGSSTQTPVIKMECEYMTVLNYKDL